MLPEPLRTHFYRRIPELIGLVACALAAVVLWPIASLIWHFLATLARSL